MPTYPVKHLETGEQKELSMSMVEYGEWRKENPDWDKDWIGVFVVVACRIILLFNSSPVYTSMGKSSSFNTKHACLFVFYPTHLFPQSTIQASSY